MFLFIQLPLARLVNLHKSSIRNADAQLRLDDKKFPSRQRINFHAQSKFKLLFGLLTRRRHVGKTAKETSEREREMVAGSRVNLNEPMKMAS